MNLVELYVTLAAFIGTTLSLPLYFRGSGIKLEIRANRVIKDKSQIVSNAYSDLVEKTIERFKTQRTLTEELEEEFERISYIRYRLNHFTDDLSEIVDKLTMAVIPGMASVVFLIIFAYLLTMDPNPFSFWLQIIISALFVILFYRYVINSLWKIPSLRNFEKIVNQTERSNTFNELYESLS